MGDRTIPATAIIPLVNQRALAVANNSKYGLSSSVLTKDFGDQIVNDKPQVPFGGVKGNGYGRFGGQAALDEVTELCWINIQRVPRTFP